MFHIFWRSHFIFSHENHWVAWSFWIGNIFKWYSNIFNTPFHLNKWKKSCHLLSRVLWWKEFEFMEIIKAKWKFWESPFIPSHLTFKKFQISLNQSHNNSNKQTNLSIYYNIPKFRILGCYKPTTLKMNLVLEIRRG